VSKISTGDNLKEKGDINNFNPLLERLNNGDKSAFDEIYKKCYASVFFVSQKFCSNKEDAEEVVQDTFLIAFRKTDQLRGETLLAYLRKIAVHESYRKGKAAKRSQDLITTTDELPADVKELNEGLLPEESLQNKERRTELLKIIELLPKTQREIVYLYYFADFSAAEISELMGCSTNNVYTALSTARKTIRINLEKKRGKIAKKALLLAPLSLLFIIEEQVFAASLPSVAPMAAGLVELAGAAAATAEAAGATGVATTVATVTTKTIAYVAAACLVTVSVAATAVYMVATSNDDYLPAATAGETYIHQPLTNEPQGQQQTYQPTPSPAYMDETDQILAALSAAQGAQDVATIIGNHGFIFSDQIRVFADKTYRFYVTDVGRGDILIGTAMNANGSGWHMRFQHFQNGNMPTDILQLLEFIE